jgi:hypothetical protein
MELVLHHILIINKIYLYTIMETNPIIENINYEHLIDDIKSFNNGGNSIQYIENNWSYWK